MHSDLLVPPQTDYRRCGHRIELTPIKLEGAIFDSAIIRAYHCQLRYREKVNALKAAVCHEFAKPLRIEDLQLANPEPGEVKVRLKACAICHSDIISLDGGWGGALPAVFGHEAAGVVTAVGADVSAVQPGDHVVVTLLRSCGHCHYCSRGDRVMCETGFRLDRQSPLVSATDGVVTQGLRTGAFAEEVLVDASQLCVIPDDMPFDGASLLACGVLTGFGAVRKTAKVPAGATVVVIGAGGVGINCIQGAVVADARVVIAIDVADAKLDSARQFGATHTINAGNADLRDRVHELTDGRGADFVFISVGAKSAIDNSISLLAKGGTAVVVGMPESGVMAEYDPGELASRSQRIIGSKMGSACVSEDIPDLVALYRQGRLKLDELISGRYRLEDINEAIASSKSGAALRNVIVFP